MWLLNSRSPQECAACRSEVDFQIEAYRSKELSVAAEQQVAARVHCLHKGIGTDLESTTHPQSR